MAKVIFLFEGKETHIQCLQEDKMIDICNKYSSKINININSLYFLYNGGNINFSSTFKEQANSMDKKRNIMNILVFHNNNNGLKCQKWGEKINLDIFDSILEHIKNQDDILIGIKNQIENLINLYDIDKIKSQIKLTKIVIDNLINENKKSLNKIQDLLNNINNNTIQNININQKQKYKLDITKSINLDSNEEENYKNAIFKAILKYSEYVKIAQDIYENINLESCSVIVGEKDKFINYSISFFFIVFPYSYSCSPFFHPSF